MWDHDVLSPEFAGITGEAAKVWMVLLCVADYQTHAAEIGLRKIASLAGMHTANANRGAKTLEAHGMITIERTVVSRHRDGRPRGYGTTIYRLRTVPSALRPTPDGGPQVDLFARLAPAEGRRLRLLAT